MKQSKSTYKLLFFKFFTWKQKHVKPVVSLLSTVFNCTISHHSYIYLSINQSINQPSVIYKHTYIQMYICAHTHIYIYTYTYTLVTSSKKIERHFPYLISSISHI